MRYLGWLNTFQAIILPGVFSAFGIFLLRQAFLQLPREPEEAALIDTNWPWLMVGSVMATAPVVIVFLLAQSYFIEGIAMTGIKG